LNSLDASAGEYVRPSLEKIAAFMDDGCVDLNACDEIEDNYDAVILRFFKGDIPMMACSGDTVSGTKKRKSRSEEFIADPFEYSFVPIPISDDGVTFIDMSNLQFSVNKNNSNQDMANEFMRFLVTSKELNELAKNKGLMSPTKDLSFSSMYAAFGNVPQSGILSPEVIGLTDDALIQVRQSVFLVARDEISIDEAVARYRTFTE
nr:extracellular solute-binding protein [Lachnospiraceae bacterium]